MEEYADEITDCGASPETVFKHETKLSNIEALLGKMDKKMDDLGFITILNGDDGKTEVKYKANEYHQMIHNRTSAKHKFEAVSTFSESLIPILVLLSMLASFISTYVVFQKLDKTKTEQTTNSK